MNKDNFAKQETYMHFSELAIGAKFRTNCATWIKQSTRTARLSSSQKLISYFGNKTFVIVI